MTATAIHPQRTDPQTQARAAAPSTSPSDGASEPRWSWVRKKAVAAWMNVLIFTVVAVTVLTAGLLAEGHWPEPTTWAAGALKLFALWCLAFLPGWLYLRFLGMRAKALWSEYVLTLHRLSWDQPGYLPEPPRTSDYHSEWRTQRAELDITGSNIYRQKFDAYYGREVSKNSVDGPHEKDFVVRVESLFPVLLATVVLATGWATVLWDTGFLTDPSGGVWDALKYGFMGAYAFVVSMLIRRFFQSDLRPSAYTTALLRIVLVLIFVAVLHQIAPHTGPGTVVAELALSFLVGFFPLAALQIIQRTAATAFKFVLPPLTSEYPLERLDGLNLWYEARLIEEGVEDMQNLTTMNLVDVILHTRVPPGRLVDWIDQAALLIRLEPAGTRRSGRKRGASTGSDRPSDRLALRRVGIRTATDLLEAFSVESGPDSTGSSGRRFQVPDGVVDLPLAESQLRLLVQVLSADAGLAPVWNWQNRGVQRRAAPTTG